MLFYSLPKASEGEAKMAAYIATDAGYAGARDLVAAVGLITVDADGTIKVSKFCEMPDCTFFPCPFLLLSSGKQNQSQCSPPFYGRTSSTLVVKISSLRTRT